MAFLIESALHWPQYQRWEGVGEKIVKKGGKEKERMLEGEMFSHSTNCVGLFEMIEEVQSWVKKKKWCWPASVRSGRQNDITPRLTQLAEPGKTGTDISPGRIMIRTLVFDHHDHHHARAKNEEWTLQTRWWLMDPPQSYPPHMPTTYAHHISPPHMPIPHMSTTATEQLPNIAFKSPSETGIEISQRPVDWWTKKDWP